MDEKASANNENTSRRNRRRVFTGLIAVVLIFYLAGPGGLYSEIVRGELAPDIVGRTTDGGEFHLHDLKGELVLLDFWASWCQWCERSTPQLEALREEMSEGYPPLNIVGVNYMEDMATARAGIRDFGMTYPSVLDGDGSISESYGVESWPRFVLLDTDRTIMAVWEGYEDTLGEEIRRTVMERRAQ
ncbi:MAG: TlpA disulfide reductase family protein [bacterium]